MRKFYVDFLGFEIDFEHRFEPDTPLYAGLSRGDCKLHLSEHHGDASPGARVRIETPDLDDYVAGLRAARYRHARPGDPAVAPWGGREITITDPFGNRLTFWTE